MRDAHYHHTVASVIACTCVQVELLGRERTPAQWKALFSDAGFRLSRIVACRGPMAVIEAVPV